MNFMSDNTMLLKEPCIAKVDEVLQDRIRIHWKATYWDADVYVENNRERPIDISPGRSVTVIGIRGIKLVVLL